MKTKLLKKVRRRYQIELVTQNDDPNHLMYYSKKPYYQLRDRHSAYYWRDKYYFDYDDAYNKLCQWIRIDYIKIVRKNKLYNSRKVWHNGRK